MTMTEATSALVEGMAAALDRADSDPTATLEPSAWAVPDLSTAYAVQERFCALRARRLGGAAAAYKVALSSTDAQAALGVEHPLFGQLLDVDVLPSAAALRLAGRELMLLEVELVFRVTGPLAAHASVAEIARATEMAAGIECPTSRYRGWFGGALPTLAATEVTADNCLAGALVVADQWTPATAVDRAAIAAELTVDGTPVAGGVGANVLGDPLRGVVALRDHLARQGLDLAAGTLVSAGTLTAPVPAIGDVVAATFDHGIGTVTVTLENGTD